jgi:hypothetical protein
MEPSTFTETRVSCSAEGACLQSRVCTPCMLFKNKYICIATADTVWRYGYLVQTDLTMQTMCGIEPCPHRIIKPAVMHGHSINMQEHAVDLHAPPPINLTCMHACIHACRSMHARMLSWEPLLAAVPATRYNCFGVACGHRNLHINRHSLKIAFWCATHFSNQKC